MFYGSEQFGIINIIMFLYLRKYFFIILPLLFIGSSAYASVELETLAQEWPAQKAPFNEWKLIESKQRTAEFVFEIENRKTGEKLLLALHKRNESEEAYARSRLYNIFYISSRQEAHTSPEADTILPRFVEWIKQVEGENTALPDYKNAIEAEKARIAKERKELREKKRFEQERFRKMRENGIRKLSGNGQQPQNFFGENILVTALLILCLLFTVPRVNKLTDEIEVEDVNYLKSWIKKLVFPVALICSYFFLKMPTPGYIGAMLDTGSPGSKAIWFIGSNILSNGYLSFELSYRVIFVLLFMLTASMVCYAAYVLSWNRILAMFSLIAYCVLVFWQTFRFDYYPLVSMIADLALAIMFISLSYYAYSASRKWLVFFTAFSATLSIWLEPAYYVLILFVPVYLVIESENLKSSLTDPRSWLVYLFIIIFSIPVFQLLVPDNPFISIHQVFLGGYGLLSGNAIAGHLYAFAIGSLILFLTAFMIEKKSRLIFVYLCFLLVITFLAALGLPDVKTSISFNLESIILPAILLGYINHAVVGILKERK